MIDNIEVFTQNSIRIKTEKGNIYFDPFHMTEEPHDADFIFVTHDHYDHFSPEDIDKVSCEKTILIILISLVRKWLFRRITEVLSAVHLMEIPLRDL